MPKTAMTRALSAAAACLVSTLALGAQPSDAPPLAIVDVTVVPMTAPVVLTHQTVVVAGDRIVAVGPTGELALPAGALVLDGQGRYLMPGLIDMHVHVRRADLPAYLRAGITSVRNMWGYSTLPETMRQIASGELAGPSIYSASPGVDGGTPQWPETQRIEDPAQADALVAAQVQAGWLWVKVYQGLRSDVYDAVLAACRRHGIRAIGHVASSISVEHALLSGQLSIEHMTGYDRALSGSSSTSARDWLVVNVPRMGELARLTEQAGTWNCPTMAIYEELAARSATPAERDIITRNRRLMVRALADAGARLLAGTDSGIDVIPAGTSLVPELRAFVGSGLTPYEALRAATTDAAEFLGLSKETGTVAVGLRADLILLDGDPTADLTTLETPLGVMLRGQWIPAQSPSTTPTALTMRWKPGSERSSSKSGSHSASGNDGERARSARSSSSIAP